MNRPRVPADCLVDPEGCNVGQEPKSRLAASDWIKLAIFAFGLVSAGTAAWYNLLGRVENLVQEQNYAKERMGRQEGDSKTYREEMRAELDKINAKLDRIIEGRTR